MNHRLGETLVQRGLISEEQLHIALLWQDKTGGRLGEVLRNLGFVHEPAVVDALCAQFDLDPVEDGDLQPAPEALALVSKVFIVKNRCLPLAATENEVTVAISDPLDVETTDRLAASLGRRVRLVLATTDQLSRAIGRLYGPDVQPRKRRKPDPAKSQRGRAELLDLAAQLLGGSAPELGRPTPAKKNPRKKVAA